MSQKQNNLRRCKMFLKWNFLRRFQDVFKMSFSDVFKSFQRCHFEMISRPFKDFILCRFEDGFQDVFKTVKFQ